MSSKVIILCWLRMFVAVSLWLSVVIPPEFYEGF